MADATALLAATLYVDPARLLAWHDHARPGDKVLFGRGAAPDQGNATQQLVNGWIAAGTATTTQGGQPGQREYFVHRTRPDRRVGDYGASIPDPTPDRAFEVTPEGRLFAELAKLAKVGLPCPSNRRVAEALKLRDARAARYLFDKLVALGKVRIQHLDDHRAGRKVVTIVETGARTAAPKVPA